MSKYYGQTAQNLRNTFDEAKKNAPSIIVIDEIDSIASTKESINATMENRMVSQLLSLLDGFYDRGGIIVIGLTNKLELLEPALLSPGRFDTIIEFTLPDEKGREEIFKIHTKRMPLEKIISIKDLANRTQNFTGADISAVCKEASLFALRRYLPQNYLDSDIIDVGVVEQIEIIQDDFDRAIKIVSKNIKLRLKLMENKKIKDNNY
jgi:transitional endoplasmic reticulum ATPase